MNPSSKTINLGEVISFRNDFTIIDDTKKYKLCKVQTKNKGVVLREIKSGFDIKTKKQQICRAGDLIFAEMDARFGGYGIVPKDLDGAIVSSHYFLYDINESLISKLFLEYCLKQPWFSNQVEAKGSTNYAGIRPSQVLNYQIPLPSLSEQIRIVTKIESVRERIAKSQELRKQLETEINNLRYSLMCDIENEYSFSPINKICDIKKGSFPIMKTEAGKYPFVVTGAEFKTANNFDFDTEAVCVPLVSSTGHGNAAMHRVHYVKGKFALSNLLCAVTSKNKDEVNTQYLYELFMAKKDEYFVPLMIGTSNVSLSVDKIGTVKIPIPPIKKQNELVCLLEKLNIIKQQHKLQEIELNDLIPSLLDKAFKGDLFSVSETIDTNPIQQEQLVMYESK